VGRWAAQTRLRPATVNKILDKLWIVDRYTIRDLIRRTVEDNAQLFDCESCYVTRFGTPGKSGEVIFYEFCHTAPDCKRVDDPWKITDLPPKSTIIFVDDLIGTGTQSLDYIQSRLSSLLAPSHKPCLFSVCATSTGIEAVRGFSTFEVLCAMELNEADFNYYHPENLAFTSEEREQIQVLNEQLGENFFVMGLLLAFYYSAPDNTMPLIWREEYNYIDQDNVDQSWFGLFPRRSG